LFVGALRARHLARLVLDGNKVVAEEVLLDNVGSRIRDVRQGPDGAIYVLTDSRNGRLLRVEPAK
ncbi:MAG: PQQ-dependent sugar dehydrogenase, partial [Hyphomicrobiaceae bacterium]